MSDPGPKPSVPYWHLCRPMPTGVSHQTRMPRCATMNSRASVPPIRSGTTRWVRTEATVVFTVQPVGWVGDWHENPAPQWIIVLSGRWFIESMDGTRIEQGPGEFSFGEDQGCAELDGKKGHRSGTVGDTPCALMTVQLHVDAVRQPCHID